MSRAPWDGADLGEVNRELAVLRRREDQATVDHELDDLECSPGRRNLRRQVLQALERLGGVDYLVVLGKAKPGAFATLLRVVIQHELRLLEPRVELPLLVIRDYTGLDLAPGATLLEQGEVVDLGVRGSDGGEADRGG